MKLQKNCIPVGVSVCSSPRFAGKHLDKHSGWLNTSPIALTKSFGDASHVLHSSAKLSSVNIVGGLVLLLSAIYWTNIVNNKIEKKHNSKAPENYYWTMNHWWMLTTVALYLLDSYRQSSMNPKFFDHTK